MNGGLTVLAEQDFDVPEEARGPSWELKKLKPLHKQVASLVAQGAKNTEIAQMLGITPQYVSMLLSQPLVKQYLGEMCDAVGVRMEALFEQSVEVIAETMRTGSEGGKLKAARLQLEATKRIGRPDPTAALGQGNVDRLERLAERLILLQTNVRTGRTFDGKTGQEITDIGSDQSAQGDGAGQASEGPLDSESAV